MKHKVQTKYCIDTSALITMHRYYSVDFIPDMWKEIEKCFQDETLISHNFVYQEIVPKTKGTLDELAKIVLPYKDSFYPINDAQAKLVLKILALFPGLIDPNNKRDEADPWLIAMCIDLQNQSKANDEDTNYVLVSMESKNSPNKIPAVCKHYGVKHMNIKEFFKANDWKLSFGVAE